MISFVVPAYNEQSHLGVTLVALDAAARAVGEPYEVIVVNDASTDRTAEIAESHGARVVHVAHRQISRTRNAGAREARGEILVFVDADTVVHAGLVRDALAAVRGGAVGGGARIRVDGGMPRFARLVTSVILRALAACGIAGGCFLYARREDFWAVGGFDERLFAAEEIALSRALARRGRFVILPLFVLTSGRKFRSYSSWYAFVLMCRFALRPGMLRDRRGLDFWYEGRREDSAA